MTFAVISLRRHLRMPGRWCVGEVVHQQQQQADTEAAQGAEQKTPLDQDPKKKEKSHVL